MKKKKKKKEHRHKWQTEFNECPFCGGGEARSCSVEGCYKCQIKEGNKWKDEY